MNKDLPNLVYSKEIHNIPLKLQEKFSEYLEDSNINYSLNNNSFIIEFKNQKEYEKVSTLSEQIKQADSLIEAITYFPDLDIPDLFLGDPDFVAFSEILPYLEQLSEKGIVFDFNDQDNDYIIDALDCVKVISKAEYDLHIRLQHMVYKLWCEDASSPLTEEWLLSTGFNYLYRVNKMLIDGSSIEVTNQLSHIVDYLNSFDFRLGLIEEQYARNEISKDSFLKKKQELSKDREKAKKSSYEENLKKADQWMVRKAKDLTSQEDWDGIVLVFSFKEYNFYQLLSDQAKDRESNQLNHCVGHGGYDDNSGIYSLRDKTNRSLATIEVSRGKIEQIQGPFNNEIEDPVVLETIREFIQNYLLIHPKDIEDLSNTGWESTQITFIFPEKNHHMKTMHGPEYEIFFPQNLINQGMGAYSCGKINFNLIRDWKDTYIKKLQTCNYDENFIHYVLNELESRPPFEEISDFLNIKLANNLLIFREDYLIVKELYSILRANLFYLSSLAQTQLMQYESRAANCTTDLDINTLLSDIKTFFQSCLSPYSGKNILSNNPRPYSFIKSYNQAILKFDSNEAQLLTPMFLHLFELKKLEFPDSIYSTPLLRFINEYNDDSFISTVSSLTTLAYKINTGTELNLRHCEHCSELEIRQGLRTADIQLKDNSFLIDKITKSSVISDLYILSENFINQNSLSFPSIYLEYTFGNRQKAQLWLQQEIYFYKNKLSSLFKKLESDKEKSYLDQFVKVVSDTSDLIQSRMELVKNAQDCPHCLSKRDLFREMDRFEFTYELEHGLDNMEQRFSKLSDLGLLNSHLEKSAPQLINEIFSEWDKIDKVLSAD